VNCHIQTNMHVLYRSIAMYTYIYIVIPVSTIVQTNLNKCVPSEVRARI
jgi:hypothetical protein